MTTSLLFTGHMIDEPGRVEPRFPADLELLVQARIAKAIMPFASGASSTMGFASGARGGDLLFHEECRRRAIGTIIVIPFEPYAFIKSSVQFRRHGDSQWVDRFWRLWDSTPSTRRHILGLPLGDDQAFAICNTRLFELARQHGPIHLIALWDGKGGDGPGGTADLVAKARTMGEPDVFSPKSCVAKVR
jgi:hypothetical protein